MTRQIFFKNQNNMATMIYRTYLTLTSFFALGFSHSFLNLEELSVMQYGLEITNQPVLLRHPSEDNALYISSKHGQTYSCNLPEVVTDTYDNVANEDMGTNMIVNILDKSLNGTCLSHTKGWWTYKVCHKKSIEQFHITEKGEIEGPATLLGLYKSEDNWDKKDVSQIKAYNLFHSQNYTNGNECDLTSLPRKTIVQYYCSDQQKDAIIRVEEPSTCTYIISIHSSKLCTHPLFKIKEKTKQVGLKCAPALQEWQYNMYVEKKNKKIALEEERKMKEQEKMEKLKKEKEELLKFDEEMNNNEDVNVDKNNKIIWKDTANQVKKFMNQFVKTYDMNTDGVKVMNFFDTDIKDETFTAETDTGNNNADSVGTHTEDAVKDTVNKPLDKSDIEDSVVQEMLELDKTNDDLQKQTTQTRKKLHDEYENMKNVAIRELDRSKGLLSTMESVYGMAKTDKERKDAQDMIVALRVNIKSFQKQIKTIESRMGEVEKFEEETEKKLKDIDEELKQTKITQAISKMLGKVEKDEKLIADTVSNILTKVSDAKKKNFDKNVQGNIKKIESLFGFDLDQAEEESDYVQDVKQENLKNKNYNNGEKDITGKPGTKASKGNEMNNLKKEENNEENEITGSLSGVVDILKKQIKKMNEKIKSEESKDEKNETDNDETNPSDSDDQRKDNVKVRIRSLDDAKVAEEIENSLDNLDENVREDVKAATKKMEDAVKQQLKEAGIDLKNDIKIKIITTKDNFDKFNDGKSSKIISDSDAKDFKDMLMGFLGGGQEKVKEEKRRNSLEENYKYVWNEEKEVDET